ncbi:hypothetical protein [Paenibacillus sp. NRS-1780]|uniref:hypothetical protein n=1 Tax=Paenibacillus sp. NRS-1780 TaxID=3233904 RepID=UPI003D2B90B7
MSTQIRVVGDVKHVSDKKLGTLNVICLEVESKINSADYPDYFKIDVQPIHYSILFGKSLFNEFRTKTGDDLLTDASQMVGSRLNIIGFPTLDLPMSIVEGDIGVIAIHLELLTTREPKLLEYTTNRKKKELAMMEKIKELEEKLVAERKVYLQKKINYRSAIHKLQGEKENLLDTTYRVDQYFEVLTSDLVIPDLFVEPRPEKIELAIEHYQTHGELPEIEVHNINNEWVIVDGYAKFLAGQRLGLERITVKNTILFCEGSEISEAGHDQEVPSAT